MVTREEGYPAAVLFRGVICEGMLFGGPGKLTKALGIDKGLHGGRVIPTSGLWLEYGVKVAAKEIWSGPRVGVDYAGPVWAGKPWRFVWKSACG